MSATGENPPGCCMLIVCSIKDRSSSAGHRCMYDFELLALLLGKAGFQSVIRAGFREGADPALLVDTASRAIELLYVEAIR